VFFFGASPASSLLRNFGQLSLAVNELHGRISDHGLLDAVDGMSFDNDSSEIWETALRKTRSAKDVNHALTKTRVSKKKATLSGG